MRQLLLATLFASASAQQSCTSGLTLRGHNLTAYDGDYLLQWLFPSKDGGQRYIGPAASTTTWDSIGTYTISPGCLGPPADTCNDEDRRRSAGAWVLYSKTSAYGGVNVVVAICKQGCPPPRSTGPNGLSVWPAGEARETVWELTGEKGLPGRFSATVSCCQRKPQPCDGYTKCPSHNNFPGIWSLSCHNDKCCRFVYPADIALNGKCVNDPQATLTQCLHGGAAVEAGTDAGAEVIV